MYIWSCIQYTTCVHLVLQTLYCTVYSIQPCTPGPIYMPVWHRIPPLSHITRASVVQWLEWQTKNRQILLQTTTQQWHLYGPIQSPCSIIVRTEWEWGGEFAFCPLPGTPLISRTTCLDCPKKSKSLSSLSKHVLSSRPLSPNNCKYYWGHCWAACQSQSGLHRKTNQ